MSQWNNLYKSIKENKLTAVMWVINSGTSTEPSLLVSAGKKKTFHTANKLVTKAGNPGILIN